MNKIYEQNIEKDVFNGLYVQGEATFPTLILTIDKKEWNKNKLVCFKNSIVTTKGEHSLHIVTYMKNIERYVLQKVLTTVQFDINLVYAFYKLFDLHTPRIFLAEEALESRKLITLDDMYGSIKFGVSKWT
jgi:hypothetical protein